jgi:Putative DNA-binding domain
MASLDIRTVLSFAFFPQGLHICGEPLQRVFVMATIDDLELLLSRPTEALDVEYKSWLDLRDDEHKGNLAKAAIALANEGGGHIVVGIREVRPILVSEPRPASIAAYDQDLINQIVRRFATPAFHCTLHLVPHPGTGHEHAVISIPGGFSFPVMSKSGTPKNTIQPHRCYIRKPGPESAPPETQADWDRLLARCIRNRQDEMLDAIRAIVQGTAITAAGTADAELQERFVSAARARWQQLTTRLPSNAPARCPKGRVELDYALIGRFQRPSLTELLDMLRCAEVRHSGNTLFWVPHHPAPIPSDDTVECWLGGGEFPKPAHLSDFWRASPEGRLFMIRGYVEDSGPWPTQPIEPGTMLDIRVPIYLIGEALLHAANIAALLKPDGDVRVELRSHWYGLSERRWGHLDPTRDFFMAGRYVSHQESFETKASVAIDRIAANLPEIVHTVLVPLYERFDFYRLEWSHVTEEITRLRTNRT